MSALAALVVASAVAVPVAAISQATAMSLFAVAQVFGSVFFAWLGVRAEKDFFLLLGNLVCAIGAIVWCVMLEEEEGNPSYVETARCTLVCFPVAPAEELSV